MTASADRFSVLRQPAYRPQSVSYTGTAGDITSNVKGTSVMVWSTTDCYVSLGVTATTANGTPLPAGVVFFLPWPDTVGGNALSYGDAVTISAIQISSGGILYTQQFN